MTTHYLKTWSEHFRAVRDGNKRAELRLNDRNFQVGDILVLQEYHPGGIIHEYDPRMYHGVREDKHEPSYSGDEIRAEVLHIVQGGEFGLALGHVMMSIEPEI